MSGDQQQPHQQPYLQQPYSAPQQPLVPPPIASPSSRKRGGRAVLVGLAAIVLLGVGFGGGFLVGHTGDPTAAGAGITSAARTPDTGPTPDPIVTPTNEYTPTETVPAYETPTAKDFKLSLKVLKKECFGSAGCNLTYRVLVAYSGTGLDPSVTYEVGYQVRGGEDGPITNTLTITGDTSSVDEEEYVSTKNRSTKLTAAVTDVASQ